MYGLALYLRAFFSVILVGTAVLFCPVGHALVISQIYGGGGNSGSTYTTDFIEIFNDSPALVDLNGKSVQYTSASGTSWQSTGLTGSLAGYHYYLVQEAAGGGGTTPLPTPDTAGAIGLSASSGKVALVDGMTLLSSSTACMSSLLLDLVGYGSADCFEGSAPAPHPSNTRAIYRLLDGLTDSNDNVSDFSLAAPNPRNSSAPANALVLPAPGDTVNSVPEPSSWLLMVVGLAAVTLRHGRAMNDAGKNRI